MKIYKYGIPIIGSFKLIMPDGAMPCHFGFDPKGNICIWAQVHPERQPKVYLFHIVGTGSDVPPNSDHIGSMNDGGGFMWHLFMDRKQ